MFVPIVAFISILHVEGVLYVKALQRGQNQWLLSPHFHCSYKSYHSAIAIGNTDEPPAFPGTSKLLELLAYEGGPVLFGTCRVSVLIPLLLPFLWEWMIDDFATTTPTPKLPKNEGNHLVLTNV